MNTKTTQLKRLAFLLPLICITLMNCHFNAVYNNRKEDKDDAEKVTCEFYNLLRDSNYVEAYKLFSNKFFAVTDTTKLNNLLKTTDKKLGLIENIKLDKWETQTITGTNEKSDYVLQYIVKHEKFKSKETFTLTKENGQIKIVGYNVNSDGFFEPEKK